MELVPLLSPILLSLPRSLPSQVRGAPPSCGQRLPRAAHPKGNKAGRLTSLSPASGIHSNNQPGEGAPERVPPPPRRAPGGVSPAGRRRGGDSGRQPPAPRLKQLTRWWRARSRRGREAATCGAACRGRSGREMWGRAGAPPPPPHAGPFIKPAGTARAWQPPLLIANSLRSLHLICIEIISWALSRETPPSFSPLCPALPIQSGRGEGAYLCPEPPPLPHYHPPSSCWQSTHLAGSPASALGEPALHQWVQTRGGTRQVICPPAWPCPGKGGGGWRAAAVAGCTWQEYGW